MSMDRAREVEHLGKAEADVAAGESRVMEQIMRIEKLRADGHDTTSEENFLEILEGLLQQWREHRDTIMRTVEQIDAGLT